MAREPYHNVTIKAAAEYPQSRKVGAFSIDGVPLRYVTAFSVTSDVELPTLVTVSFYANVNLSAEEITTTNDE